MLSLKLYFVIVLISQSWQSYADTVNAPPSSPLSTPFSTQSGSLNFLSVWRSTGELVIVVHFHDVCAIKRVVGDENGVQMIIMQATDSKHLVHNIYDPMYNLKECKATKNQVDIDDFRRSFHTKHSSGFLSQDVVHKPRLSPHPRAHMKLLSSTSINLEYIYNATESKEFFVIPTSSRKGVKLHSTIRMMLDVMEARRACRDMEKDWKSHLIMTDRSWDGSRARVGGERSSHDDNEEEVELDAGEERGSRERRSIFIVPGTLWCGSGNIAKSYDDLGEHRTTDMCCREHDHCPYTILSWENKFNIFNHRLYTLSDCDCDTKFRDCLLNVNDSMSRAVGDAYFNLLGCACFQLKEEEECISRSWWPWNACSRYQQIKRAIVNAIGPVLDFIAI